MAAVLTETKVITLGGSSEGRIRVVGNCANTAVTTFVIAPGHADTNVSGSANLRTIDSWGLSNSAAQKAPIAVKTYSSTNDADIITITCASDDDYDYWVEGASAGA